MYYLFVAKDLHITAYIGKEGYELVHCEYLISEKGKLCILKRK